MLRSCTLLACVGLVAGLPLVAQNSAGGDRGGTAAALKNPLEHDPDAIRNGAALYRTRCASCHGADAKGASGGGDLTSLGEGEQPVFQSIRRGLPNTLKPHSFGPDNDVWTILVYLRSLETTASAEKPAGNAPNGERVFSSQCAACHQVNGTGGHLGPDLSQIASNRSRASLAHKVRHASSYIMSVYTGGFVMESYQPVTLVTRDGKRIRGVKKNEDAFSIQIMDSRERLQGFLKSSLREVVNDDASLMPDFGADRVSESDLEDLLAYLETLRAAPRAEPRGPR